jgi:hypothetical protein
MFFLILALLRAPRPFEPHAYYVSHCPKAAGASFVRDLLHVSSELRKCGRVSMCFGEHLAKSGTTLDVLRRSPWASSPLACNFATCEMQLMPSLARAGLHLVRDAPAVRVLLMLRSPRAHVVSHYAHVHRGLTAPPLATWLREMRASIGTNSTGWHPYNMQVAHMTGAPTAEGMGYGWLAPHALQRAKASVDLAFHVGVVEQYVASFCLAAWRIAPRAPLLGTFCSCDAGGGKLNHLDHGANTARLVPSLGEAELSLIDELTREDQQLYAYARARFFADVGSSPLPRCLLSADDPEPIPPLAPPATAVEGTLALAPSDGATCRPTLPTVVILGCQKCATSSLHTSLVANFGLIGAQLPDHAGGGGAEPVWAIPGKPPRRAGARLKETHFFDTPKLYARGAEAYASLFPRACGGGGGAQLVALDSTPSYLSDPAVPGRMRAFFAQHSSDGSTGHLRLIAVVRDPTERLRSAFNMMARNRNKHNRSERSQDIDRWALSLLVHARRC